MNFTKLAEFLLTAKKNTYAAGGKETSPQRPGFIELSYTEGPWSYRDSYTGWYMAPGQEVVRFKKKPVWIMSYSGGMVEKWRKNESFTKETFTFLKEALMLIPKKNPFRGPKIHKKNRWVYKNKISGHITDFKGTESISYNEEIVFKQNYIGGIIQNK